MAPKGQRAPKFAPRNSQVKDHAPLESSGFIHTVVAILAQAPPVNLFLGYPQQRDIVFKRNEVSSSSGTRCVTRGTSVSPVISVRSLTKTYQVGEVAVHALRGVSLEVQAANLLR